MTRPDDAGHGGRATASASPVDLRRVADAMQSLSEELAGDDQRATLQRLVTTAVDRVPQARWASVSMLRSGRFTTGASSGIAATRADRLQYEIGSGPCVDAILEDSVYVTGEVASDPRWTTWGQRATTEVGVRSVLAQRLHLLDGADIVAGLNIYSDVPDAFDDQAVGMGLVLATHASLALSQTLATQRAENLMRALKSNREIGVAMGILMQQHHLTRDQAFDVLRVASQDSNRKLADIAADVADTGTLHIPRGWGSRAQ
jgi:ANTAR domain/GAF domain